MPKHLPTIVWNLRKAGTYPNGYVRTTQDGRLDVALFLDYMPGFGFSLDRRTARLLAKRINQILDETQ